MPTSVFVLRPEPGLSATMERGRALGLSMYAMPLSQAEPVDWHLPEGDFDGILLGSANGLRHAGPAISSLVHLPVYAVGEATAADARARGFSVERTGEGGLQGLLDTLDTLDLSRPLRFLRLAGEERLPVSPPPQVQMTTAATYRIVHRALAAADIEALAGGGVVLLHSGAVAQHFARQYDLAGLERGRLALAALAPRIAASISDGWKSVRVAAQPRDAALLSLAADMCH